MQGLMRFGGRPAAPDGQGQGDVELGEMGDRDRERSHVVEDGPSVARATGRQVGSEGQRHRRWTTEEGEEMG